MSGRYVRAVLAGFCVALVISGGLSFLAAASGRPTGLAQLLPGLTFGAIVAFVLASLAGNRRSVAASPEALEAARTMLPPPGRALVYAYRDSFVGMAAGVDVELDGRALAQLKSPRFTCCAINPGEHVLTAAFGGMGGVQRGSTSEPFTAEPGEVLVFRLNLSASNTAQIASVTDLVMVRSRLGRMQMTAPDPAWAS